MRRDAAKNVGKRKRTVNRKKEEGGKGVQGRWRGGGT